MQRLVLLSVGFILGLLGARLLWSSSEPVRVPQFSAATTVSLPASELSRVTETTSAAVSKPATPDSIVRDRLSAIEDLNAQRKNQIGIPLIGFDSVDVSFSALYGLSEEQTKQVNACVELAKKKIDELEAGHLKVVSVSADMITLSIASFPAEGGLVYDQLMASVKGILGPEKAASFDRLTAPSVDKEMSLDQFGLTNIVYRIDTRAGARSHFGWGTSLEAGTNQYIKNVETNLIMLKSYSPMVYQQIMDRAQSQGAAAPIPSS